MRALVTGAAGFLGRHFRAELGRRGWHVDVCDLIGSLSEQAQRLLQSPRAAEFPVAFDPSIIIRDCLDLFRQSPTRYDLVVHAAAYEPHRAAIEGAVGHLARNLHLDTAMFCWAEQTEQRRVLYLSSSAAYPVGFQTGHVSYRLAEIDADIDRPVDVGLLRELGTTTMLAPDAGYGWTKLTGERMAAAANDAGLPVHVVRPFSGYGEDQDERWPFGAFAARARRRDDPFDIWGSGTQVRDWVHVDDVVNAALAVADADVREPINICTGVGTSMLELAGLMCAEVGYHPTFATHPDKPTGVAYRVGDPTLLGRYYTPKVDLAEGVRRALAA